ncbi:glucose 1-dehydrogenase/3-oxoacyl-[acyl-carrier protein] reductase [Pseudonocardia cypriaca]|uniref:Glucose 1-dehydrogenase/3-oxoacyl-[acyl-carrier protein] reductase n=1 Tax=Pseudonocardia cypriaca TaxID=882449 RepID=A0A543GB81_9PSEU|nr:glucose 1-dehydrogenase/3-oxoacyl-[acyl-carrier protein] reductase [Pseudonocardia cypriaca]
MNGRLAPVDPSLPALDGTVALVTGGSGGIGSGIALRFAAAGAAVVVHHNTGATRARAVVDEIVGAGGRAVAAQADVTDPAAATALVELAVARFGRLDSVVAAAGVQPVAELAGMTVAGWREVVDGNVTGAFATVQAAAAALRGRGGSITLVASVEGTRPARGHAHYAAAKAATIMLARAAALEYGCDGVRVNSVSPGLVARAGLREDWPDGVDRWERAAPLRRLGEREDVADACVFLASPMARWVTGHDLVVDGGMSAVPAW